MRGGIDLRDVITGGVVILFGIAISLYATDRLPLGTPLQMGPGMFPLGLGVLHVVFGLGILLPALRRAGTLPDLPWRACLNVLAAIAAFALLFDALGLVAGVLGMVLLATLPGRRLTLPQALALSVALVGLLYLIFAVGLGMPLVLVKGVTA